MKRLSFSFLLIIFGLASFAQEEDPYADYSYLWAEEEKTKKPKKEKKIKSEKVSIPEVESDSIPKKERKEADKVEDFRKPMSGAGVDGSSFLGGFTYTRIGGQDYAGLVLAPDIAIGKIGVGLNVPILYGLEDQKIRTEIFKDGVGPLRLIRYLRYGRQKEDPVFIKVGELQNIMLGYGGLVNFYTNTTSYEKRKVGAHFDFNWRNFTGIEGLYSDFDFTSQNLLSIRPYVRPLAFTDIPIAKTLEIGAIFTSDKDQTNIPVSDTENFNYSFTESGINAFGFDIGLSVLKSSFIQIDLFATYNKLNVSSDTLTVLANFLGDNNFKNGSGSSFGANFRMHFIADIFKTDIRIERLSYSDNYLPQFFDASYELQKDARIASLIGVQATNGIYGSLTGHVLNKIQLGGSLMIPNNISTETPALVRVHADLDRFLDKYSVHASYTKVNLDDLGDAFRLDDRSLAKIQLLYHINKFIVTGVEYYYYWEPNEVGDFQPTRFILPYFGVNIDF